MQTVTELQPLNTYIVIMDDGTLCKVRAGSYALTMDGCWTFWKERAQDPRVHGKKLTPLVSIKARKVDAVAHESHYEGEVLLAHTKNDKNSTQLRKVTRKTKNAVPAKTFSKV